MHQAILRRLSNAASLLTLLALALGGASPAAAASASERKAVQDALREYMAAYQARDIERLANVWRMEKAERLFIERTWEQCEEAFLSVKQRDLDVTGNEAWIDFDQSLGYRCQDANALSRQHLRASLKRARKGGWRIDEIVVLGNGASADAVQSLGAAPVSTRGLENHTAALDALDAYEAAMQRCDLDDLASVLIMSRSQRRSLDSFCRSNRDISVSVEGLAVDVQGDRGTLHFAQRISFTTPTGSVRRAFATLRASMVRRSGGEWAIWGLRARD